MLQTTQKKKPSGAHSVFSASAASRWTQCPGSIALPEVLVGGGTDNYSYAAAEGTALHELMEWCLLQNKDAVDFDTMRLPLEDGTFENVEITDEQYAVCQDVVDRVREIPGRLMVETRVNYASVIGVEEGEGFGTCDIAIIDGSVLHVADAKFGRRAVGTQGNLQMLLYAIGQLSVCELLGDDIGTIRMEILQPRVSMKTPVWEIAVEDLQEWAEELRACAHDVQLARADLEQGTMDNEHLKWWAKKYLHPDEDACRWCPAALACPELQALAEFPVKFFDEFEDLENPKAIVEQAKEKTLELSADALGEAMGHISLLKIYCDAIEAETTRRLSTGMEVTGFKLVRGRAGTRYWTDKDNVEDVFHSTVGIPDDLYMSEPKLKSPSQVASAFKKLKSTLDEDVIAMVDSVLLTEVSRNDPKPTLAPSTDPRPDWHRVDIEAAFEDLA